MSTKSLEVVNIHEQRRCLDKLDDEIDKALNELDTLNSYTMNLAKKVQKRTPVNKLHTPTRSSSTNVPESPDIIAEEPTGVQRASNPIKIINQEGKQHPTPSLAKIENQSKEIGYSSIEINGQIGQKENTGHPEGGSSQKKSALPANFWVAINEKRKQKNQWTEKKEASSLAENSMLSKENSVGAYTTKDTLNATSNQKSLMEYHKLSNLDLPREIIHGSSKPEHFFGFQKNLRKQGLNGQQNSPKSAQVKQVVNRLMQYGRDKEERQKAIKEGKDIETRKKQWQAKSAKSKSFMYKDDDQSYFYEEEEDVQPVNEPVDENVEESIVQNHPILEKKGSLRPSEITPSQINQALGVQYESKSSKSNSIILKGNSDPSYQLYKEGNKTSVNQHYGKGIENKTTAVERVERSLTPTKKQGMITYSSNEKHQNTNEQVKTLRAKANYENSELYFRPKLSKRSMEMAAKLGDSFQRLVDTSINKATSNKKKLLKEMDTNLTFKPTINKKSAQLDEKFKANVFNGDDLHRWDQLYLMKDKYNIDKELRKLERERIEKENDECTFHPKLNKVTSEMFRDKSVGLPERTSVWKEMRDRKLKRERSAVLEKEIEECTFVPSTLSPVRLGASRSAMNLHDLSQSGVKGLDNYYEKVDKANRMKRELEARQEKFSGKCWKRQITVPKEFHLSKNMGSLSPFSHSRSMANLDISTEEKIYKNVVFLETREGSPQGHRTKDMSNNSWMKTFDNSITYDNFGNSIVKLHYELQRMEI